jgi:hypothetical protein
MLSFVILSNIFEDFMVNNKEGVTQSIGHEIRVGLGVILRKFLLC